MLWPKIINLVSLDLVHYVEPCGTKFSHIGPYYISAFCRKMRYVMNALAYHYETRYVSLASYSDTTQKASGQRHLVVKSYNQIYKYANNV